MRSGNQSEGPCCHAIAISCNQCDALRTEYMRLRIVPLNWHPRYRFSIGGLKVNGKRRRLFFETEREAREELRRLNIKTERHGQAGLDISDTLRVMAVDCERQLKPFGKTIAEATTFFVKHLAASESPSIDVLIERYIASQERKGLSARYLYDIRRQLTRLGADFGSRPCRTVSTADLEQWLFDLHNAKHSAPKTIISWRIILHGFFGWALGQKFLDSNPVDHVPVPKLVRGAPEIWKPEELDRFLHAAPPELVPALAIGAFAGLRNSEVLALEWREINLERGFIEVTASKSKTAQRRLVKIEPNLSRWLAPHANNSGKVWRESRRIYYETTTKLCRELGLKWPENGLRHSFASYHLAHFRNAAALALEMGHMTPHMLFAHYRELVTPADAARYWEIVP
jgi:integrase